MLRACVVLIILWFFTKVQGLPLLMRMSWHSTGLRFKYKEDNSFESPGVGVFQVPREIPFSCVFSECQEPCWELTSHLTPKDPEGRCCFTDEGTGAQSSSDVCAAPFSKEVKLRSNLSVCMCVTCVWHTYMNFVCMIKFVCVCVCSWVCVEVRGQPWVLGLAFQIVWDRISLLFAMVRDRPAGPQASGWGSLLFPPLVSA